MTDKFHEKTLATERKYFEKLVPGATVLPPKAFSGAGVQSDPSVKTFATERFEIV